jgi:hypothetical protein
MFPVWMYFVVAAVVALAAFAIGQFYPGMGAAFAGLASTGWVAYVAYRQRGLVRNTCGR